VVLSMLSRTGRGIRERAFTPPFDRAAVLRVKGQATAGGFHVFPSRTITFRIVSSFWTQPARRAGEVAGLPRVHERDPEAGVASRSAAGRRW
jgi:hypothetical protein